MDTKHLGGHLNVTHVDEGALKWLVGRGVRYLLDVGCSVGWQVDKARDLGIEAWGLDGDYSLQASSFAKSRPRVLYSDLTTTHVEYPLKFDAVWCCEVAEHIDPKHTVNLLTTLAVNLKDNGLLVFTANEGPGYHHVNCKPMSWWIGELAKSGLRHDPDLTKALVASSTMTRDFIRKTGNIFIREYK